METKAKCGNCTLFWCPKCLLNRYGEEVEKVRCMSWQSACMSADSQEDLKLVTSRVGSVLARCFCSDHNLLGCQDNTQRSGCHGRLLSCRARHHPALNKTLAATGGFLYVMAGPS